METQLDIDHYQLLLDHAQIGWWEADFEQKVFVCSDFLKNLFGVADNKLPFADFQKLIGEEFRYRIISDFSSVRDLEIFEQLFPVYTCYGLKWVRSKLCKRSVDADGRVKAFGMMQLLPNQKENDVCINNNILVNDLLGHLGSVSHALYSFIQTNDLPQSIHKVLTEVLYSIDMNGRAYIMEYNDGKQTLSCIYEVCSGNASSALSSLQDIPLDTIPWSTEKIKNLSPVIINNLNDMPAVADEEKYYLEQRGVLSLILIPLVVKDKAMGYMGIDIVDTPRIWSSEDYQWLSSIANVISIITEMVKINYELDRSGKILRNIYTNIPVGIELYDKEGVLVDMNNRDVKIFGLSSKEDALGVNLFDNPVLPVDLIENIRKQKPVTFRFNYPFNKINDTRYYQSNKNGYVDLITKVSMLYDNQGELLNYLFINLDNTDNALAYNRIEEFEYFFSLVSNFAKVGYAKFDLLTRDGYAISQWYRNLGEEDGTPLPEVIGIYKSIHPEDALVMADFFEKVKRGEADSIRNELRVNRGDDNWTWTRVNVMRNTQNNDPDRLEMICVNYDISELKESQKLREKAEELDRLKSAFLANMSHEIRTPLNAIVGFSTLLVDTDDQEDKRQFADIIQKNNDLLLQLISDVLDLAKIESNTIELKPVDVDLHELFTELSSSLKIKMPAGVELRFGHELPSFVFRSDPVRLTQVLSNFVNNAVKYTSEGSITLNFEVYPDKVEFSVTDTGEGITPENLQKIFNRFFKGNNFKQGTGLGLSICKSIVEQMEGEIGVKSELGKGSCFWFTLPR